MESMLDFSASPAMFIVRGTYYSVANKFLGEPVMSTTDALFTFLFGVGLPSWDVYSDLGLIYGLLTGNIDDTGESHPKYAVAMLCPVLLSTIFLIPQWWNIERKTSIKNKIWTFFLVLIQFWPQWKMIQMLYKGLIKKDPDWKNEKENLLRNVGNLGKNHKFIFCNKS